MKIIFGIIQYGLAMISGALILFSFQLVTTNPIIPHSAFFFAAINISAALSLIMSVLVGQFNEGK